MRDRGMGVLLVVLRGLRRQSPGIGHEAGEEMVGSGPEPGGVLGVLRYRAARLRT